MKRVFPKFIVVVIDDDMVKYVNFNRFGVSDAYSRLINSIMVEYDHLVEAQKEFLPKRSKNNEHPIFIWIAPPTHDNFSNNHMRKKLSKSIETTSQFHKHSYVLHLKKGWDATNPGFFLRDARRYTAEGLAAYWIGVDKAIKYVDTILLKKIQRKQQQQLAYDTSGKYHWRCNTTEAPAPGRKLPRPPPI